MDRRLSRAASEATMWPRTLAQLLIVAGVFVPVLLHGSRRGDEIGAGLVVLGVLVLWPTLLLRRRLIAEAAAKAARVVDVAPAADGPVLVEFTSGQPSSPVGSRLVALRRTEMRRNVTRVALGTLGAAAVLVVGVTESLIVLVVVAAVALVWLLFAAIGLLGQSGTRDQPMHVPAGRERVYTITAASMRVTDGERSTRWPWSAVLAVAEWPETYVFTARNGAAFTLPRDTMTGEQEKRLRELITLSRGPGSPRTSREGSPARRT